MKYCPFCGQKPENTKHCIHCGANLTRKKSTSDNTKTSQIAAITISFLVVVGIIIIIKLKSSTQIETAQPFLQPRTDETVISIREDHQKPISSALKREGYDLNAKPFDNRNYEYDQRTKAFRFVCKIPCPVSKDILDQEFNAIDKSVSILRGLTQSDLHPNLLPFEVHASEDEVCGRIPGALAYANRFQDLNGYTRGKLCFFFEQLSYDRTRFPYSTSVHEVTHLFEFGKIETNLPIYEGLAEVMESFFLRGTKTSFCDQNNKWWLSEIGINPHDPHDTGRELFFQLCIQYGFDYDDLPTLFQKIDQSGREITTQEFIQIINQIVGTDTTYLFQEAGAI